jgi:Tfp pilus assembly protein PilZ
VLAVGDDAEACVALHPALARAGHALWCAPSPGELEPLLRLAAPELLLLLLPAAPDASWGGALSVAAGAARAGVRVVLVAPDREAVGPLATVAGAERALARADVLARPLTVLERGAAAPARPQAPSTAATPPVAQPPSPASPRTAASAAPAPAPPRAAAPPPPPPAAPARPAPLDDELDDGRRGPVTARPARVEVNVSLVSEHNFFVGATRRLDSGGVFISTAMPPPVGTPLQLRLGLADGRKLDLDGEVTFVRARSALGGRQPSGCGVRLSGLPTWALDAIERFVAARPPIVWIAGR